MENDVMDKFLDLNKGSYGYLKRYRRRQLLLMFLIACFIIADVVISLLVFKTRKTWFIVLGTVMSIPFARNMVNYIMIIKAKALSKEEYEKAEELSEKYHFVMAYDISVTGSEGLIFYPCLTVFNNNIIAYVPAESDKNSRAASYLKKCHTDDLKPRVCIVDSFEKFEKEISKIKVPKESQKKEDLRIAAKILTLGL